MVKTEKNKHGTPSPTPDNSEEQATVFSCVKCGKVFSKPIELTIRSNGSPENYNACPHCFAQVTVSENTEKRLIKTTHGVSTKAVKETIEDTEKSKPIGCAHFLGYLKKRPESSQIPDECLTCASIMKCMGFA